MRKLSFFYLIVIAICASCSDDNISPLSPQMKNEIASRPLPPIGVGRVQIGNQIWMTKNLNVSRYRNGDIIPQVQNIEEFTALTTGAWCYYGNNSANASKHGKLYNWYAVNDPRGLAPAGWHVASSTEWDIIQSPFLPNSPTKTLRTTTDWYVENPDDYGNNSSGFSCYPSGARFFDTPSFDGDMGLISYFWTSTNYGNWDAVYRFITPTNYWIGTDQQSYHHGMSVRCVKD